jgi:polysaccharide export outer membrane protein
MTRLLPLVLLLLISSTAIAVAGQAATTSPAVPAAGAVVGSDYLIGPGDVIQVFVWRNDDLTVEVPVRPDGKISTRLVEDMVAVGKTPSQLARDIEKVLAEFVRSPQVNIIVTQPASTFSQVRIIGQVKEQRALPFREGMTVLDAVLAAGGLAEFAAGNRAKLIRTEGGKEKEYRLRLGKLLNDGDMSQNLPLRPGDVLMVPGSRF